MPTKQPEPRYLAIGRILRPHGVRGELRLEILTDYPERVADLDHVYLGPRHRRYAVKWMRLHRDLMLLQLEGVEDRDVAETLRGQLVEIAIEDAVPLEEGEYYHFQVVGVEVETEEGESLGEVVEVLSPPNANEVFVVHGLQGEILIPAIDEVVLELDLDAGRMVVRPLPGMLPEEA